MGTSGRETVLVAKVRMMQKAQDTEPLQDMTRPFSNWEVS